MPYIPKADRLRRRAMFEQMRASVAADLAPLVDAWRKGKTRAYAVYLGDETPGVDHRKRRLTLVYTDVNDPAFVREARYMHDYATAAMTDITMAGIPVIDLSGLGKYGIRRYIEHKLIDLAGTHPNDPAYDTFESVIEALRSEPGVVIVNV
jgi:hypothetical protein